MGHRDPGIGDLPLAGLTPQLAHRLDQQQQPERAGMVVGQPAPGRQRGKGAAGGKPARLDECAPSPLAQNPRSSSASRTVIVNES